MYGPRRYTYATTIQFDGDEPFAELEVEVTYEVAWGSPESGRFGPPEDYDPGCASVVEAIRVEKVNGQPRPWNMTVEPHGEGSVLHSLTDDQVEAAILAALESDDEAAAMIEEAAEDDASRRDSYLEQEAKDSRYVPEPVYDDGGDW